MTIVTKETVSFSKDEAKAVRLVTDILDDIMQGSSDSRLLSIAESASNALYALIDDYIEE